MNDFALARKLLDIEMETKGLRRYVRTAEGARKYRKPIGALIEAGDRNPVERARKRRDENQGERAVDAAEKASNNESVPYQVIRADKELKKVDLKSGAFTQALLGDPKKNEITNVPADRTSDGVAYSYSQNVRVSFKVKRYNPERWVITESMREANPDYTQGIGHDEIQRRVAIGFLPEEIKLDEIEWQEKHVDEYGARSYTGRDTKIEVREAKKTVDRAGKLKYVATLTYGYKRGGAHKQFLAETPEEAFEAAARAVVLRDKRMTERSDEYDAEGMWPLNRAPRDYDGVIESWPGVRGWDFYVDPSDEKTDFTSYESRVALAQRDAVEQGYLLLHNSPQQAAWGRTDASAEKMSVQVMETVNALMRSHEERFPGFSNLFSAIALVDDDSATAYNGFGIYGLPIGGTSTGAVMGMNAKFFADNATARAEAQRIIDSQDTDKDGDRWAVSRGKEAYRVLDPDMTGQQMVALGTMTHEIGHTIGYILQGRLHADALGGQENTSRNAAARTAGEPNPLSLAVQHRARMLEILKEYGIFDPKKAKKQQDAKIKQSTEFIQQEIDRARRRIERMDDPNDITYDGNSPEMLDRMRAADQRKIQQHLEYIDRVKRAVPSITEQEWMDINANGFGKDDPFNRQAISEHLSTYGATNVSEIFAETWAAYQLDPNPGDYVREMGELMETALLDYLAVTDQSAIYKGRAVQQARRDAGLTTFESRHLVKAVPSSVPGHPDFNPDGEGTTERQWREDGTVYGFGAMNIGPERIGGSGFAVVDTLSEDPPKLVVRQLRPVDPSSTENPIVQEWKPDDSRFALWEFNFETEKWEQVNES